MVSRTPREKWVEYAAWLFLLLFVLLALIPTWWAGPLAYMCSGAVLGIWVAQKLLIDKHSEERRQEPRPGRASMFRTVVFWALIGAAASFVYQILCRMSR